MGVCRLALGAVLLAACGGTAGAPSPTVTVRSTPGNEPSETVRPAPSAVSLPPATSSSTASPDAPAPSTTLPNQTPEGCHREPIVELVSNAGRMVMDLIYYAESAGTCGYNADGEAMFNDAFRPATAAVAPEGELAISIDPDGATSVDIQPLEPGLRLANIRPSSDILAVASNGTYPIALPGPGCFVVTVGWRLEERDGQYTGLAESEPGDCHLG